MNNITEVLTNLAKTVYKQAIVVLLLSAVPLCLHAQSLGWAASMGGTGWDEGATIATDSSGNVYSVGYFRDTVDFDPGTGVTDLIAAAKRNIFITKMDSAGHLIWAKQIAGTGWGECNAMTIKGDLYLAGSFRGTLDFDPGPANNNLTSVGWDINIFICRIDTSGNLVWVKKTGGSLATSAHAITVDDSGYVYTTGYFDGVVDMDPGPGTFPLAVTGYSDMFVSKLTSSGDFVWARQISGPQGEIGHAIAVDDTGNVYTTGTFAGTADFDPGSGTFPLTAPATQQSMFVCKLDASGNFAWAKLTGGATGYSIIIDHAGDILTTGYYDWNDIAITKFDASGGLIWHKQFGAYIGYALAVDGQDNIYSAGEFFGTRDFDPGTGTFNMTASGSNDTYISKLDASGNLIWARQLGGTSEVKCRGMALDAGGRVYTTGYYNDTADFDPSPATHTLVANSSYDIFVHQLKPDEDLGISGEELAGGMTIYPNPNTGAFTIAFAQEQQDVQLVLRNLLGQTVATQHVENIRYTTLQIDGPPGVYLLEVIGDNNQKIVSRIVKE